MKKMHAVAGSTLYRNVGAMSADSENRLRGKEMDRERGVRTPARPLQPPCILFSAPSCGPSLCPSSVPTHHPLFWFFFFSVTDLAGLVNIYC